MTGLSGGGQGWLSCGVRVVVTRGGASRLVSMLGVAVGETIAGLLLALLLPIINEYPHILALYPVMAAARGNIYASLGSRITSRLHLGLFDASEPFRIARRELPRVLLQSLLSAIVSATIAYLAVRLAGGRMSPSTVYGTALLTPLLLAPFLVVFTVYAACWGFRRGLDPDEYLTPLTTLISDIIVLPVIVASALTAAHIGSFSLMPAALIPLLMLRITSEDRRVLAENMGAILTGSMVEFVRSYALVSFLDFFNRHPYVLAILPTFNAENGASLGVLSSRIATRLHLGLYRASPSRVLRDALGVYTASLTAYAATSLMVSAALGHPFLAPRLLLLMAAAGALVSLLMTLVAHITAREGFRRGLDPDNILIPLVTTLTDTTGTLILLLVALLAAEAGIG